MITTTIRGLALTERGTGQKQSCVTTAKSGLVDQMLDNGTNHTILNASAQM